jgi:hypothetical protein
VQLSPSRRAASLRGRLRAAACLLLASGTTATARADPGTTTQADATLLVYGEQARAKVTEPTVRVTRLDPDGQALSARLEIDAITGASPSGALPTGVTPTGPPDTYTTASGRVVTVPPPPAGQIPLSPFKDTRVALDGTWIRPLGLLTSTLGGHVSREKDYQSLGINAKTSLDLMHRLTTLTLGGGLNHDSVFPVGGTPVGLSAGGLPLSRGHDPKRVATGMVGLSRILTRRWMVAVSGTRTWERGYLTEPYKVLSLMDSATGQTVGQVTEKRPSTRFRTDILGGSVYHLAQDILYVTYRYYWDDWSVRSHTFDVRYRHPLPEEAYVEPHVRLYTQTAADFFRSGFVQGEPLPEYATSDIRLGALRTATVGATVGFHIPEYPGEWTVRAEYIGQFGPKHPNDVVGVQRQYDLFPTLNIGTLVLGYSIQF